MIVNTGGRTDTVQYYSDWLLNRFAEGYALSRNPMFPHKVGRIALSPSVVDCVVFCSKNYAPILPRLHEITDRFNTYFFYTITAYGPDVEPGVPSIDESVDTLVRLAEQVGPQRIAWRYDPVLLTKKYTVEGHFETFERMVSVLSPHVSRCIFSFVELYKKVEWNMPGLIPLSREKMETLAEGLGAIAARHDLALQICGTTEDWSRFGIAAPGCIATEHLGRANDVQFRELKHPGTRIGCHCAESRDIGAYDTCPNGCKYCYANQSPRKAAENFKRHDPRAPLLVGELGPDDTVIPATQKSFLEAPQLTLGF